jgi:hypothetical protein
MHDTCNTVNLVATKMMELCNQKANAFFDEDVWASMTPKSKSLLNFLCENHTRNLPLDHFNQLYTKVNFVFRLATCFSCL